MIEVIPREHPESESARIRDSVQLVAKFLYFVNLAISVLYCTILLIVEKRVEQKSLSFVLILLYGFLAVWVFLFDLIFVVSISL